MKFDEFSLLRLASALHILRERPSRRRPGAERRIMKSRIAALFFALLLVGSTAGAAPSRSKVHGSVSPSVAQATDDGREPASTKHEVLVGLALRNRDALEAFLQEVQDPSSPRYGQFLTQEEFNQSYAPTPEAESALASFLGASGL